MEDSAGGNRKRAPRSLQTLDVCRTLVDKYELSRKYSKVKCTCLVQKRQTLKTRVLFKVTHLRTFTEQKILLFVTNIENEPSTDYAMHKHRTEYKRTN